MTTAEQDLRKRLLFILHLGFVEVRNLALASGHAQIAELADALETLPRFAENCTEEDLEVIRSALKGYQQKYQSAYDYPARLDEYAPPDHY